MGAYLMHEQQRVWKDHGERKKQSGHRNSERERRRRREEAVKPHIQAELWWCFHLREFPVGIGKNETILGMSE